MIGGRIFASLAAVVLFASGCSSACQNTATTGGSPAAASAAPAVAPGFYRHSNEATVYDVVSPTEFCTILSPAHMTAYGGVKKVHVVSPEVNFLAGMSVPPSGCVWPDGRYRKPGADTVIRVSGSYACQEPPGNADVQNIEATDNPLAHKTLVDCSKLPH